jgi:hypothetical protein
MSVTEIVIPPARSRCNHQQADASSPGTGKAPDSGDAQISQIWTFGFLTGTEPTSVQNGGDVRITDRPSGYPL